MSNVPALLRLANLEDEAFERQARDGDDPMTTLVPVTPVSPR